MTSETCGYRLSPQQRRIWLLHRDGSDYCAQMLILLKGPLDRARLKRAVEWSVARHEVFRTKLLREPGLKDPLQVVSHQNEVDWSEENLVSATQETQDAELESIVSAHANRKLADRASTPFRAILYELGAHRNALQIFLSPVCADAQTLQIVLSEITNSYGVPQPTIENLQPMQYVQFSEWQNELLASPESDVGRAYWREQNPSDLATLALPFENRRTGEHPAKAAFVRRRTDVELASSVKNLAARCQASPEIVMFAAWEALLWRFVRQPQIVLAKSFDGREYKELHDTCGACSRWLPVRSDFRLPLSFRQLVAATQAVLRETSEWQHYFVLDDALPGVVSNQLPIGFDYYERNWREVNGVTFEVLRQASVSEPLKLMLHAGWGNVADVQLQYDACVVAPDDAACLAEQYAALLRSASADSDCWLEKLNLNPSRQEMPVRMPHELECVHQLFQKQALRRKEEVAVLADQQRLTYSELDEKSNQLARFLQEKGVGPEQVVGLFVDRGPFMVIGLLGILKAGGAYLPLDTSYPESRLSYLLEDSAARIILTEAKYDKHLNSGTREWVELDTSWAAIAERNNGSVTSAATSTNLAYVIYTSGSSGQPKGVMVEHAALVNYLRWAAATYLGESRTGCPVHSPVAFDLTVTSLLVPLINGDWVQLLKQQAGLGELAKVLNADTEYGLLKLTPSHLEGLRVLMPEPRLRPQTFVVGGESLRADTARWWMERVAGLRIFNEYGPTETVVGCSAYELTLNNERGTDVSIGHEIAGARIYILNDNLQEAGVWETGQIYIAGAGVARGYLGRPAETAVRFLPDLAAAEPGRRMYRSGDLGRRRGDGELEYLGRDDDQVKIRGYRVEPGEIESAVCSIPGISQAAVVAKGDKSGTRLICYLVSESDVALDIDIVRQNLQEALPEYMLPAAYVLLKEMPLTPNGKIDKAKLASIGEGRRLRESCLGPQNALEQAIYNVWLEALHCENLDIRDRFFDLGGHSLLMLKVHKHLEEVLKRDISLVDLFTHPTVQSLAAYLASQIAGSPSEVDLSGENRGALIRQERQKRHEDASLVAQRLQ